MSAFLALRVQVGLKSLTTIMSFHATSILVLLPFYHLCVLYWKDWINFF
jgi:hypothetical protein